MSAEIQSNDQVVMHKVGAWHGMGIVVDKDMTPRQAAMKVFPWEAEEHDMIVRFNGQQQMIDGYKALLRSDDHMQLGIVASGYHVLQPYDMADFAEALLEGGQVKIETAGSIRGGKRLWFLLKGEPFNVALGDEIYPYFLLSNGYDGLSCFAGTPTTIRTVCSNTFHMVVPHVDTGELGTAAFKIRHTANAMERIAEAREAIKNYGKSIEAQKEFANILVAKDVTQEVVQKFFLECYTADFGEIPENPKDGFEERRRMKAQSAYLSFSKRFDDERQIAGANMWNAMNAYTGLVQHDQKARGKDDVDRLERRVESNLFGLNTDRTQAAALRAFKVALSA